MEFKTYSLRWLYLQSRPSAHEHTCWPDLPVHTSLPTYLSTCLPTYLPSYLSVDSTDLPTYYLPIYPPEARSLFASPPALAPPPPYLLPDCLQPAFG